MPSALIGRLAETKSDIQQQAFRGVAADASLSFAELARAMAAYNGPLPLDIAASLGARLHALRPDVFRTASNAEDLWRSGGLAGLPDWRDAAAPYAFFSAAESDVGSRWPLLPPTINRHRSDEMPAALTRNLANTHCPGLDILSARAVSLFCSPAGFQVFSQDDGFYVPSATSRPFSTALLDLPHIEIDRPVVLVQDIFHGVNFAHFLFDWITRVMAFAARKPVEPRDCIFVMGGFPQRFHQLVLNALMSVLALEEENFLFPEDQVVLRSRAETIWFSDTCDAGAHPAQMFRPESTEWLRRIARAVIPAPPTPTRRLYISRADVGRRMVANEAALASVLETRGFETLRLSDLPVDRQIALVTSATHVVGAHGMGLTHLAFHPGKPFLLELFNPEQGTDAYAFMAKGLGFDYAALLGRPAGAAESFVVPPDTLTPYVSGPVGLPSQRWFPGVQTSPAAPDSDTAPRGGALVLRHVRDGITSDSNVGWWELYGLPPGQPCRAGCDILIPPDSDVADIVLHLDGAAPAQAKPDLARRGIWQSLVVTGTRDPATHVTHLVLRMNGAAGCSALTSAWSVTGSWGTGQTPGTLALHPR